MDTWDEARSSADQQGCAKEAEFAILALRVLLGLLLLRLQGRIDLAKLLAFGGCVDKKLRKLWYLVNPIRNIFLNFAQQSEWIKPVLVPAFQIGKGGRPKVQIGIELPA
jgi:hypothetical protein